MVIETSCFPVNAQGYVGTRGVRWYQLTMYTVLQEGNADLLFPLSLRDFNGGGAVCKVVIGRMRRLSLVVSL